MKSFSVNGSVTTFDVADMTGDGRTDVVMGYHIWNGVTNMNQNSVFTDSGYKKASLAIENACRTSSAANRAKIEAVWKRYTADYLKDRSKKQNQVRPLHQLLAV